MSQLVSAIDPRATTERAFDLWSEVYDDQLNPLLVLEERILTPLLPPLADRSALDAGCGTGRWLLRLEALHPASLTGTDTSPAMLSRCRDKVRITTQLHGCPCSQLPVPNASQSLILSSFVLGYLTDPATFAAECARTILPGGTLLLSDMHPQTAEDRGWRRSFHTEAKKIDLSFVLHSINEIVSTFTDHGFTLTHQLEPSFGPPEQPVFAVANKLADFESLSGIPAIYILKFERSQTIDRSNATTTKTTTTVKTTINATQNLQLTGCTFATNATTWHRGIINIEADRITSLDATNDAKENTATPTFDLSGYALLPGLINAHDHLDFGLFPNLGRNPDQLPYRNATEWAAEIHILHGDTIKRHQSIPRSTRLSWGAIRNLLCGVTTVCHHNPLYDDLQHPDFPIRVVTQFGWSHSVAFDPHLSQKFHDTPPTLPFVLHAAEGTDLVAQQEIFELDRTSLLDARTILIHGLALTTESLGLINSRRATLVVCPTSAQFLYGQILSPDLLSAVHRLAIGSDSSLTAKGDLLDEIQSLRLNSSLQPSKLFEMVTTNSAEYLHLRNGEGHIREEGIGDLVAIRGNHPTPSDALSHLTPDQVECVILSGRVHLASDTIYNRLPQTIRIEMQPLNISGNPEHPAYRRWIRAPLHDLSHHAEAVLGKGNLRVSGRQVHYAGTL